MSVNREYMSTVFAMLFSEPENALSLYNAVNGTEYKDASELRINTLHDASGAASGIFSKMRNDLSFVFGFSLNVYEHQSTLNPNMPLRMLHYVSDLLRGMVRTEDLYRTRRTMIPTPRFIVFYTGPRRTEEEIIYRLSDQFEVQVKEPDLEVRVRAVNINPEYHSAILERCGALQQYMEFAARSRKGLEGKKTETEKHEAMRRVVEQCIEEGILAEFLRKHQEEVIMSAYWEYDEEAARRAIELDREQDRKEAREEGLAEGRAEGRAEGFEEGSARTAALFGRLIADGRMDDLNNAVSDAEFRDKLFREYGM